MKKPILRALLLLFAALALTATRGFAADPASFVEPNLAGLQVSLNTSGYKFLLAEPETVATTTVPAPKPLREWFAASALLTNRSNTDISFTFPTPVAAQVKWTFRIFDSAGVQLWKSDDGVVSAQVLTEETLNKRARWKRLIQVPLRIDGKLLAPGIYTLEASIESDKSLGATAIFEVALPSVPPGPVKTSGIKGSVLLPGEDDLPAAGALVNIIELPANASPLTRAPFVWSGRADDEGKFQVFTPAGRFRVTASAGPVVVPLTAGVIPSPLPSSKSVEVTVTAGAFSEVTIRLGTPLPPPPVRNSGIKGLVLIGPISPVAVQGEPNEAPLAGAPVYITEIREPGVAGDRPAFQWTGVTDREGRFQAATPAGRFKVAAAQRPPFTGPIAPAVMIPMAMAEVTVEQGTFADVTLHLDSGIR